VEKSKKWRIQKLLRKTVLRMIKCTFENGGEASLRHCVVNVILINDNKILLVRRAPHLLNGGLLALPGGFMDRNEDSKQASVREVREETGYESDPFLLLRIADNPDRPKEDRQNIAFVFVANSGDKSGEKDEENTSVEWFDFDKLPSKEEFAFDHYENIKLYTRYMVEKFPLPVIGKI
jgi:8-oxo-dGTP diphosphatase